MNDDQTFEIFPDEADPGWAERRTDLRAQDDHADLLGMILDYQPNTEAAIGLLDAILAAGWHR